MNNDISQKLDGILKKMNSGDIQKILQSPVGRNIAKNLSNADKDKLMREFASLDSAEIQKKLAKADLSKFSGLSADEIIRRFKSL